MIFRKMQDFPSKKSELFGKKPFYPSSNNKAPGISARRMIASSPMPSPAPRRRKTAILKSKI